MSTDLVELKTEIAVLAKSMQTVEAAIVKIAEHQEALIRVQSRIDVLESNADARSKELTELRSYLTKAGIALIMVLEAAGIGVNTVLTTFAGSG